MVTRADTAAATKRSLLDTAAALLDAGGPEAVTLRAVGAAAGVSRGAPYGHFPTKADLLTALATEQWSRTADQVAALRTNEHLDPTRRLRLALAGWLDLARRHPHLYALMFVTPTGHAEALMAAASGAQDAFLDLVGDVVSGLDARRTAALLLSTVHGVAGLEQAGQLGTEKWGTTADELVGVVVDRITG